MALRRWTPRGPSLPPSPTHTTTTPSLPHTHALFPRCLHTPQNYGTITHMPPELLTTGELRPAADVFSFGVLSECAWALAGWVGGLPFFGPGGMMRVLPLPLLRC